MKKLMMLAALLAMLVVAAVPAVAQVAEEIGGQETESGEIEMSFEVSNEGNNSNQCATALQFGTTGNVQNAQGVLQYDSVADDFEFGAGEFEFGPANEQACEQAVQQSAAASD